MRNSKDGEHLVTKHGFTLVRSEVVSEYNATADLYRHDKTGAELLSIRCDDENKVFGITFRTPPSDSTGVAHILEHSVLCGSKKYPVKEPFVELLKGSLQTFLNAFTYPDKTCYPVASQNLQDFYNLVDVYLDAVLYPLLTKHTHAQEAWHYEIENPADPLVFKGVVFNEMKGVYSSPDSALAQWAQESVFPDITYGLDYGGDPAHIPDLTYEALKGFHDQYYHPSNSRIWFYGDDDPEKRLEILNAWLSAFEKNPVDSRIPPQKRLNAPREVTRLYHSPDADAKSFYVRSWLLNDATDTTLGLAFDILNHILVGTPASPLRKALIDSGIGEDIAGIGLENQLRQFYFSTGLKGIDAAHAPRVAEVITTTLEELATNGIDEKTVEAALNTVEFRLRENNTGNYPRGLSLMVRSLAVWLYEGDPIAAIRFEASMKEIREKASDGFFEALIREHLIANKHRVGFLLKPSPDVGPELEAKEKKRLADAKASMSPAQIEAMIRETAELKRLQVLPDPPEALKLLPMLKRKDLSPDIKTIPLDVTEIAGTRTLYHDIFTQNLIYLDIGFDLQVLPQRLLSYVPLLGRALIDMGTQAEDYVALSQRIGSRTGGITPTPYTSASRVSPRGPTWLFLRGKAMATQGQDLCSILGEILLLPKLDQRDRFKQIVLEEKSMQEAHLVPSGHSVVNTRIRGLFNPADAAAEQMKGASYLLFLRELADRLENNWSSVRGDLDRLHRLLVNRKAMIANVTTDAATWASFRPALASLLQKLPDAPLRTEAWELGQPATVAEGLSAPTQVNYVGLGGVLFAEPDGFDGSALVVSRYLRSSYLWERVRVQGGAYGGFSFFDYRSGLLSFVSYRDPNVGKTLDAYRAIPAYLRELELSDDELTKAIIGAIGDLDAHQLPDTKGFTSMTRWLCGDDDTFRQKLRDQVLGTTPAAFKTFADGTDAMLAKASTVILGSEKALADQGGLSIKKVM